MATKLLQHEYDELRQLLASLSGISLSGNKRYLLENRLQQLLKNNQCRSFSDLLKLAKDSRQRELQLKLVDAMTTNETLWFRDIHPFVILGELLIPELARHLQPRSQQKIRIWSAACSTGQEPYSIAMTILEAARQLPQTIQADRFEIVASDISSSALAAAKAGRYDRIAMGRGLERRLQQRYFRGAGRKAEVIPELKEMVNFTPFNLQSSFRALGKFDIIFCRNVAIYFAGDLKRQLFQKFSQTLNRPGYLILGASESVSGYSNRFELFIHGKGCFYRARN